MKMIKKALMQRALARYADRLDREDLEFVREVTADPRFARLMDRIPEGADVTEEVRLELARRLD